MRLFFQKRKLSCLIFNRIVNTFSSFWALTQATLHIQMIFPFSNTFRSNKTQKVKHNNILLKTQITQMIFLYSDYTRSSKIQEISMAMFYPNPKIFQQQIHAPVIQTHATKHVLDIKTQATNTCSRHTLNSTFCNNLDI